MAVKVQQVLEILEQIAPPELACSWDNVGLLVDAGRPVTSIMTALDITADVVRDAAESGCELIVSHHPVIFDPLRRVTAEDVPAMLLQNSISAICMHTNLDAAPGGVNDVLADLLRIENRRDFADNCGRIGTLNVPTTAQQLAETCSRMLHTHCKFVEADHPVEKLAEVSGAGGSYLQQAIDEGADCLVTGEAAHHIAILAKQKGVGLVVAGHWGTEHPVVFALKDALIADALPKNIAGLQRDLGKYRITYDVWFHESDLHKSGAVDDVIKILMDKGACYKAEDGAIMYRSAQYASKYGVVNRKKDENADGEEEAKDEVLVRANGIPTYFAADIAYHYNKLAVRGFDRAIDIWGADHHGHVARMKGAMDAVGLDGTKLDVVLMQMVNLMRDGKPVRMSKRTGKAITLTDLLDEVPIDSARFFFNQRESSSTLDFDLDLAVRNDSENPVYYVQYAHARICSVLKKLEAAGVTFEGADALDASLLTDPSEQALLRLLSAFPAEIAAAAEKYDPARITRYVIDIATAFHRFYNACRILEADPAVRQCRMALCLAVRSVIRNVLTMFKVTVPESM